MLDMNILIGRMKRRLPDPVFKAVTTDFFIDVLMSETLPTYSQYYPKIIKGILVTGAMAIETIDTAGKINLCCKYVVPLVDDLYPYTGIATFNYPRNYTNGGTYSNAGAIDAFSAKVMSSMNMPDTRFTASFEAPNVVEISPPPKMHMDFSMSLYQTRRLEEVKNGYEEWFKKLFECDVKIALYHKLYTISDGGSYGGIEIKDYVSKFEDYESKRDDLLEEFQKDFYKDPDRFDEIFSYNQLTAN